MTTPIKRPRGRPPLFEEPTRRYQVRLPASVAERLRVLGNRSLSQGIVKVARRKAQDLA